MRIIINCIKGEQQMKKKKQPSVLKRLQPFLAKRKLFIFSSMLMSVLAALFGLVPYGIVYLFSVEI